MGFSADDLTLFDAARAVMAKAYAPYSGFPVGAAIRTEAGTLHAGCNVENVATPLGQCAEGTAIGMMVAAGEQRIVAVAVVAQRKALVTPCGGCRQRLAEFSAPDTPVILGDLDGPKETVTVGDLLPLAFNKNSLT